MIHGIGSAHSTRVRATLKQATQTIEKYDSSPIRPYKVLLFLLSSPSSSDSFAGSTTGSGKSIGSKAMPRS